MPAPSIFVSTGTLVPGNSFVRNVPRVFTWPLYLPHRAGIGPSPDRFIADTAYQPLKELRNCWVEPLVRLGLASREASVEAARIKLRELIASRPGAKVIVVGQSQGGLIVAELALDPEFAEHIAAAVFVGAPFLGSDALEWQLLKWSTCFPGVAAMQCGHPSQHDLAERMVAGWPSHIRPVICVSPDDELVSERSAQAAKFPTGIIPEVYWLHHQPPTQADVHHLETAAGGRGMVHLRMCRHRSWVGLIEKMVDEHTLEEEALPLAA